MARISSRPRLFSLVIECSSVVDHKDTTASHPSRGTHVLNQSLVMVLPAPSCLYAKHPFLPPATGRSSALLSGVRLGADAVAGPGLRQKEIRM